jgi:ABC-type transport system involved in cytochrome c biogenesis ATPase subunit
MSLSCAALLRADGPQLRHPGLTLFADLRFDIRPGLTLVRGGDGRGKTSLMRLMAGDLQPDAGRIERTAPELFWFDPRDPGLDDVGLRAWLAQQRQGFSHWDAQRELQLLTAFDLTQHLDKTFFMVSTGTRRKIGLVAAFASGAALTLLDTPYAALDASARDVVSQQLDDAARQSVRAVVVADFELPPGLEATPLSGLIDLGD